MHDNIKLGLTGNGRHGQWNYSFEDLGLIMRQVPQYLIIGNGRRARHLAHFSNKSPHYFHWHDMLPALLHVCKQERGRDDERI
jgi:hypothetical protein